ncbi:MAG: VOC family protein [Clostridia bacterium]
MSIRFAHNNLNVLNLEKSIAFYQDALNLTVTREIIQEDFKIVYLGDSQTPHLLELTWLKNWDRPYNLGDNEFHLAFISSEFEQDFAKHKEMGIVCYVNENMGIYFISDPDGYWLEVLPER